MAEQQEKTHKVAFANEKTVLYCGGKEVYSIPGDANFKGDCLNCDAEITTWGTKENKHIKEYSHARKNSNNSDIYLG